MNSRLVSLLIFFFWRRATARLQSHLLHMPLLDGQHIVIARFRHSIADIVKDAQLWILFWRQQLKNQFAHITDLTCSPIEEPRHFMDMWD